MKYLYEQCDFCGVVDKMELSPDTMLITTPNGITDIPVYLGAFNGAVLHMQDYTDGTHWCAKCKKTFEKELLEEMANKAKEILTRLKASKQFDEDLEELLK